MVLIQRHQEFLFPTSSFWHLTLLKGALRGKMSKCFVKPGLEWCIMGYLMVYSSSPHLLLPLQDLSNAVLKIYSSEEKKPEWKMNQRLWWEQVMSKYRYKKWSQGKLWGLSKLIEGESFLFKWQTRVSSWYIRSQIRLKGEKQSCKRQVLVNTLTTRKCKRVKQTTLQQCKPTTL